jgi:hypothetical protein
MLRAVFTIASCIVRALTYVAKQVAGGPGAGPKLMAG